jgi:hypothetical protein
MATPDLDATPTNSLPVWTDVGKSYILDSVTIDFSVAANFLAQNEIVDIYDIPAGTVVEWAIMNVITADTDVTDVNLGVALTGVAATNLIDAGTLAAVDYVVGAAAATPIVCPTADSKVTLINIDADTINEAKVQFIVKCTPAVKQ